MTVPPMDSAQLQNANAFLKLVERTAFVGVWMIDLERGTLSWSEQLASLYGAAPGFVPSLERAFSFYAPEWREKAQALFQACATEGVAFDEEMQIITLAGRRAWVRTLGH